MKHFKPGTNRETIASALDGCCDLFDDEECVRHLHFMGYAISELGASEVGAVIDEMRASRLAEAPDASNDN